MLVSGSQGPIFRVPGVRVPYPRVASPKYHGPSSRVLGPMVLGLRSQGLGPQVLILDYAVEFLLVIKRKYKLFDVTKFILVLPTFRLIQQSLSKTRC